MNSNSNSGHKKKTTFDPKHIFLSFFSVILFAFASFCPRLRFFFFFVNHSPIKFKCSKKRRSSFHYFIYIFYFRYVFVFSVLKPFTFCSPFVNIYVKYNRKNTPISCDRFCTYFFGMVTILCSTSILYIIPRQ